MQTANNTEGRMEKLKKLAVGYARVSTQEQADTSSGLEWQSQQIREYAASEGYSLQGIYHDVYTGRGIHSFIRRLDLQDAIKIAKTQGIPIIVTSVDRLTRRDADLQRLLKRERVRLFSLKEREMLDHKYNGPAGQDAQRKGDLISSSTKQAHDRQKAMGMSLGHPPSLPAGRVSSRRSRALKAHQVVLEIADYLQANPDHAKLSRSVLCDQLNAAGHRTSTGRVWTHGALRRKHLAALEEIKVRRELDAIDLPLTLPD